MGSCKGVEKKVMVSSKGKRERAGDGWEKVFKKLKAAHEATSSLGYLLGRAATWDDGSALETSSKLLQTILHGTEAGFSFLRAPKKGQRKQQQEIVSEILTDNPYADGHAWKKYGEKDIKDAIFRREYYRCSNEGCAATKTVEKKYEGYPPYFWVAYKNDHTCISTNVTFKQPATSTIESIPCNIPLIEVPQLISFEQQQEESNQHPEIFAPFTPPGSWPEQNISGDTMHSTKRHNGLYDEHGLVDFTTFEEWQELLKPFTPLEDDDIYTKMLAPPPSDVCPSHVSPALPGLSGATPLSPFTSLQAGECGGMYAKSINILGESHHHI